MHTFPGVLASELRGFSGVHPNAYLRGKTVLVSVLGEATLDRNGALKCLLGVRKGDEETVSCMVHLGTLERLEARAQGAIVPAPKPLPRLVAESVQQFRRIDDVSKHECAYLPSRACGKAVRQPHELAVDQRNIKFSAESLEYR